MNAVRTFRLIALSLILSGVAALLTATPVKAADGDDTYAAIAYSPNTGNYGYGYNFSTRKAAENEALNQCNGDDARVVVWGRNAYVALAVGEDGSFGSAWGSTEATARRIALQQCRDYGSEHPKIVVCVYSGD